MVRNVKPWKYFETKERHLPTASFQRMKECVNNILNGDPLQLKPSGSTSKKIIHVLMLPIILPLWLTINWIDVRKPGRRKFFIFTYILSLVWIGIISYLLVWWTTTFGRVVALPAPITGLVFFGPIMATPCYIILGHAAKFGLGDLIFTFVNGLNIFTMTIG